MSRWQIKDALRYIGLGLFIVGLTFMPIPVTSPKAVTSVFPWIAWSGALMRYGAWRWPWESRSLRGRLPFGAGIREGPSSSRTAFVRAPCGEGLGSKPGAARKRQEAEAWRWVEAWAWGSARHGWVRSRGARLC